MVTKRSITRPNIDSIVTKIAIQMCTKLGGAPWLPAIPEDGLMTIGFDVSIDTVNRRRSYGAIVATMDLQQFEHGQKVNKAVQGVNFFSAVSEHFDADNLSTEFSLNIIKALRAYLAHRDKKLPRIFFFSVFFRMLIKLIVNYFHRTIQIYSLNINLHWFGEKAGCFHYFS